MKSSLKDKDVDDKDNNTTSYTDEHVIPLEELAVRLDTNFETGLTESEAKTRLEKDGPNSLTPPAKTPTWLKFIKTMFGGFAMLLWIAAALCFLAFGIDASSTDEPSPDNLYIGFALTGVVILSGVFTFYQENKSSKIMESFQKMLPPKAKVLRDNQSVEIEATELVIGDVVDIQGGDKTPADLRILESFSIKVDNSSLTG